MSGRSIREWKKEVGAVQILEASIVFPVMFIVLIFMIFMGNAFLVRSQVESAVTREAIEGAAYCADPLLQTLKEGRDLPAAGDLQAKPYRYLFGGMDSVEDTIRKEISSNIEGRTISAFGGMFPKIKKQTVKFNNAVIYSTFSVEVEYNINFPIRMFGDAAAVLTITSRAEAPVDDTSEFIRNTDMVLDLFGGTKTVQFIKDMFGKINDFMNSFSGM